MSKNTRYSLQDLFKIKKEWRLIAVGVMIANELADLNDIAKRPSRALQKSMKGNLPQQNHDTKRL